MRNRLAFGFAILMFLPGKTCFCQSAQVTVNALFRTFMIETNMGRGTAFSIDVDNREYWITAKHMFTGVKHGPAGVFTTRSVQASILSQAGDGPNGQQQWEKVHFQTIDPGKDIDIIVLVPDHLLLIYPREFNLQTDLVSVAIGGDCTFLGFPYGGGWSMNWEPSKQWLWVPYIKHCTVSGQQYLNNSVGIYVLDGINNEGFSGGPVLIDTGANQRVFAVISGFHQEPLEVMPAPLPGQPQASVVPPAPELPGEKSVLTDTNQQVGAFGHQIVEANSGFIIAFNIQPAIDAIRANPTGPLRPESSITNTK